jgi:hypothetical protein
VSEEEVRPCYCSWCRAWEELPEARRTYWLLEIKHWQTDGTNFTSVLLSLICKADSINTERLAMGYPEEVAAANAWSHGMIPYEAVFPKKEEEQCAG